MVDAIFDDPRLARIYDALDPDRHDLDVYLALANELEARSVLDIGCGTGTPERTHVAVVVPAVGRVESWEKVTDVTGDLVTFRSMTAFARGDVVIESTSTLRFRLEFVFIAQRSPPR